MSRRCRQCAHDEPMSMWLVLQCDGCRDEYWWGGDLRALLLTVKEEIEHWHSDLLTEDERNHPRGSGWARVYDRVCAALGEAKK